MSERGNFGILVGGGPAPGLNGVISAVTLEACRRGHNIYGIYDGYRWLVKGDEEALRKNVRLLTPKDVEKIHNEGGSFLRTSRTNPGDKKHPEYIPNAVKMLNALNIQYMVTTGGDDTSFGASKIAEASLNKIKFAHVPKTIDNDLPLPHNLPTFGYETARELGSSLLKNLIIDAETTGRWYIVVVMGRTAGHLALGINKSASGALAVIPEEFEGKKIKIQQIGDIFETSILLRRSQGQNHGVFVIAEGVAECLEEEDLKRAIGPNIARIKLDQFGHIPLADVELGKIVKQEIEERFEKRNEEFRAITVDLGYVLRCTSPIPFDQEYTRELGYHAVNYLLSNDPKHQENAIMCVFAGKLEPLYFKDMIDPKTGKTSVRRVDIHGKGGNDSYKVARSYMNRLERCHLENLDMLNALAKLAKISPEDFKKKYEYLVS